MAAQICTWQAMIGLLVFVYCFGCIAGEGEGPVVSTVTGQARGTITHATDLPGKPIYTFLGIPYAAPPVGDFRYRPPQPALPWEGVREAMEYGPYCPQNISEANEMDHPLKIDVNLPMSEDCLRVNVFTPTVAADASLPVLLWIFGGGFVMGMGSPPGWESLAAHQDVVVVSFNYRVGALGFLSTGDENIPGNYGFLDQVRAMEWVKENIRNFGGDPDRVTIFGESAGGISISYHLLSPLSNGLFQRAISQSGTWKTFPVTPQPLPLAQMIAGEVGCETEDTATLTACLKEKSAEELLEKQYSLQLSAGLYFTPVVDGTFITTDPMKLMKEGEAKTVDYLLGVTNHEFGWLMLPYINQGDVHAGMTQEEFVQGAEALLAYEHTGNPNVDKMVDAIVAEYRHPTTPDDPMAIQHQFSHVHGDYTFVGPTVLVADHHAAAGGRVFVYENQYRPSVHPNRPDWVGCDHSDDFFMISGLPFVELPEIEYTREDREVSLSLMAYWANFARTGDPSDSTGGPTDSPSLPTWPQYTPDNPVYMKLDVVPTTGVGLKPEKAKLWNEIIPKLAADKKDEL